MKNVKRCAWAEGNIPVYIKYHDEEWGKPVHDDRVHFEFLILEGAQAGLSWLTILKRRDGYRRLYKNFNAIEVANFDNNYVINMLKDPGIIRNKLKVRASIKNAQVFINIQEEFGTFDKYIWQFVGGEQIDHKITSSSQINATSPESDALSKDLKNRGMSFVGSTIIYAHMQATGLINDHEITCFRH